MITHFPFGWVGRIIELQKLAETPACSFGLNLRAKSLFQWIFGVDNDLIVVQRGFSDIDDFQVQNVFFNPISKVGFQYVWIVVDHINQRLSRNANKSQILLLSLFLARLGTLSDHDASNKIAVSIFHCHHDSYTLLARFNGGPVRLQDTVVFEFFLLIGDHADDRESTEACDCLSHLFFRIRRIAFTGRDGPDAFVVFFDSKINELVRLRVVPNNFQGPDFIGAQRLPIKKCLAHFVVELRRSDPRVGHECNQHHDCRNTDETEGNEIV